MNTNNEFAPCTVMPTLTFESPKRLETVVEMIEIQQKLIELQQRENAGLRRVLETQSKDIEMLKALVCSANKAAAVCK